MSIRKKTTIKSHLVNLADYQIIKEINRGGFGIVYLIEHQSNKHRFAAKVNFRPNPTTSIESKYISREIGILMRIEAPTIIRFCGFSLEDFSRNSNVTILMKYYEHGSLRQLIEQEQKGQSPHEYDNTTKQIILCGIAHGMMTLHSRRVLHRDLKPDNVLLDEDFRPHITDFGLSKFLDPTNSKSQSMSGCGTASYMSPEVINDTHYSSKSDVYSFGILMFEVLTGEFAFSEIYKKKNFNPFQIQSRVSNGERPTFNVPIKPSFKKLIERCWSQDPKARPTFRELFHKLSLSLEDDDEMIESSLQDMISGDNETEEFEYLLDDVDTDQLFDYVFEITSERTKKEEELQQIIEEQSKRIQLLEEQTQRIQSLEEQTQRIQSLEKETKRIQLLENQINQLKIENQRQIDKLTAENQKEIAFLRSKLKEITSLSNQPSSTTGLKPSSSKSNSPLTESVNPLEGLTIRQIKEKIKKEKLTNITIPSSVTTIGESAFSGCSSLTQITIPSSVTSIGNNAFSDCRSLTQIIIPSSVTSIGSSTFHNCSSLAQITIPSSVTSIGNNAFYRCSSLTEITIPSSVTSIGNKAFSSCSSLTQITIPSSVTSIGSSTFYNCSSLTQITIPVFVTSIGNGAFSGCTSLTQITIPLSVTSIGNGAFGGCYKLDSSLRKELVSRFGHQIF